MANKRQISTRVDEAVLEEFRAAAKRQGWKFSTATEIALKRFVHAYSQTDVTTIGLVDSPAREMRKNGVQPLIEAA